MTNATTIQLDTALNILSDVLASPCDQIAEGLWIQVLLARGEVLAVREHYAKREALMPPRLA